MSLNHRCPSCGTEGMEIFYEVAKVPVNSVLLLSTKEEALAFPTGDIALGFCKACGFIANTAFEAELTEYSSRYEATQAYSPTFNAFARRQATSLIEKHDLHEKTIIEIGCGMGEFLIQLCELGNNRGIGFDPAYLDDRIDSPVKEQITFFTDFYTEKYTEYQSDFVCCKMTLEHIDKPDDFINTVRRSVGDRPETIIYFQIPNALYVLDDIAFWDVYYEHCAYFSKGSLARLFRRNGFDVLDLNTEYNDQYLTIEARPIPGFVKPGAHNGSSRSDITLLPDEDDMAVLQRSVAFYAKTYQARHDYWRDMLVQRKQAGERVVFWGGGSKAVSFLTTLGISDEVEYAVDINPLKHGTFLPVTGQEVIAPERLQVLKPRLIIAMNPIYLPEIQKDLDRLGVDAELIGLE